MNNAQMIQSGCDVVLHFAIRLEDGTPVESSFGGEPITFTVGDGTLEARMERNLRGLQVGDHKVLQLGPGEAYGYPDPDNLHTLRRGDFAPDLELAPGVVVAFTTPAGEELGGVVQAVEDDQVIVDFSHPLAGHQLQFEVEVLEVSCPV